METAPDQFVDVDKLLKVPLFHGLEKSDLQQIMQAGNLRKVEEGGFFFFQGDPAEHLYVLTGGRVKLTQANPDGQQVLMRAIGPYTLFGAIALSQNEVYPVSAEAAEACVALSWTKKGLMAFIGSNPLMAMNAIHMMAGHVQEFQERFRQLATERVERRLAHTLLRLASQTGRKTEEGVLIDLPLTRQDLAEMTGTTLFTVSRTLKQWEDQGLVICGRERVIIHYPHGLVSIAEDLPLRTSDSAGTSE
jgi:CRP-like cAMP-binding protein